MLKNEMQKLRSATQSGNPGAGLVQSVSMEEAMRVQQAQSDAVNKIMRRSSLNHDKVLTSLTTIKMWRRNQHKLSTGQLRNAHDGLLGQSELI